jgi:hypothetical protein
MVLFLPVVGRAGHRWTHLRHDLTSNPSFRHHRPYAQIP